MLTFNASTLSRLASALLLLAPLGVATPALAETPDPAAEHPDIPIVPDIAERKIIEHMQEANLSRLKGWPGMIFYCPTDEARTPVLKQICLDTYKNLETLAVEHHVKFHKARNANDVILLPHLTGRLKVVIQLNATDANAVPSAISGHIAVLAHYVHALNRSAEVPLPPDSPQAKHPLNIPQHVDTILWESSILKATAGGQDQLTQPVVQAIDEKLKDFFAEYDKANR